MHLEPKSVLYYIFVEHELSAHHSATLSGQLVPKIACLKEERSFKVPVRLQSDAEILDMNFE